MEIKLHEIPVREVVDGYLDSAEGGVVGYGGKLDIRPAFQREFIYKDKQRDEVVYTVMRKFPLNVMYWTKNGEDFYEMLDGQQRTISICQYVQNEFSVKIDGTSRLFSNLTKEEQKAILDYKLMIYICEGTDKEKLDWFKIINIAGEQLMPQELLNAIFTGKWLTEAKKYFSKTGCPAYQIAEKYMNGTAIRQSYLEAALKWIAAREDKEIEDYMAAHQHDTNCDEIWLYFQSVINWVKAKFPQYRKEMKGLPWGLYYNNFGEKPLDADAMEEEIVNLMEDDDVTKKSGIYEYLLDGDERHLSIRAFSRQMARAAYERQKGVCKRCKKTFAIDDMEADHIKPWSEGGKTNAENCQMLCRDCNRRKSNK